MSNIAFILVDNKGPFIRSGTVKYRPASLSDVGNVRKGETVKAWPVDTSKLALKVITREGVKKWTKQTG